MDRYGQRTHYDLKTKFMLQTTPFLVPGRSNPFVSLQQICRQIYTETAMLPFSGLNHFWYLDDLALQILRKRLLPIQFHSITKLVFFVTENVDMPSATGNFDPARFQNLRLLTRLKYIRIVVLIKLDSVRAGPYSIARWIENPTFARIQASLEPIFLEAVPEGVDLDFELRRSSDSDHDPHENGILDATPRTPDVMAITQRNSATSPLLRLPAEVRNKIFTYVNSGLNVFLWNERFDPGVKPSGACWKPQVLIGHDASPLARPCLPSFLGLQATCRQIYNETALLPFPTNKYWYFPISSLDECKTLFHGAQL
ncbi:hypothetical protein BKA58DRAFT_436922 [Alternaria rosae]|uniref:uncharacterized protein n=1 Tax=Alternaria rosae TaxID=1187941 RepID=UPI001E8D2F9F|nr:uncharacterized protein BKA58DRAFT_436922 [Alternaria rosae]KAH6879231.1 hypothetical protein BKA58DRAFT_436922 [Alternaria rosae]